MGIKAVVFDLGGVMARICQTWDEALAAAGLPVPAAPLGRLQDFAGFDEYQAGLLDEAAYLAALTAYLGVAPEEAKAAHCHILVEPYPGTDRVVEAVRRAGLVTGCLSNTNALHWDDLVKNGRFPALVDLQVKVASHLVGANKPSCEIYRAFENAAGIRADECLFFEDIPAYVEGAVACGWQAVWIDPKGDTAKQMSDALANLGVVVPA
ncbi:MAG: HAD-IA family hydrolase [Fimbriimonadaceae bacterium]|nr:HAD-IA family hydrolase [Fimbriimonadaceae bacterium]QYK56826.1 MAG: HAD-IA family hydrolase [Fimbriimonadaceae bacterium]